MVHEGAADCTCSSLIGIPVVCCVPHLSVMLYLQDFKGQLLAESLYFYIVILLGVRLNPCPCPHVSFYGTGKHISQDAHAPP